ncbi:hypothetical protein F5Y01DRAFT_274026 [Xylaria sp. FL0043]|nr:hypothetical protein F5Y01DRAFT_274026 [Xylaria sp. FL0043]
MSRFGKNPWPGVARQHRVAGTRTLAIMDRTSDAPPARLSGDGPGSACCRRLDIMLASRAAFRAPESIWEGRNTGYTQSEDRAFHHSHR